MNKRISTLLAVIMLVVAACGGGDSADTTTAAPTSTTQAQQEDSTTAAPEATTTTTTTTTTAAPSTAAPGETVALSTLREAMSQSSGFESARMEGSILISGAPDLEGDFEMAFSGAFSDEETFSFTMDLSGIAAVAGEEIPAGFEDLFSEISILQIGDTTYMKMGFLTMLGVTTEWVSFPTEEGASAASDFTGGANPSNPADFLSSLEDANAEVTELGTEDVRGVKTTHYRAVFDIEALEETMSPEEYEDFVNDLPPGAFPNGMPMDFWVGDDGRIYRFVIDVLGSDVEFASPEESFDRMVMTYEVFDYGADIEIVAPPPDQVTDGSELGGLFGSF